MISYIIFNTNHIRYKPHAIKSHSMNIFYNKNHILFHFVLKDISNPLLLPTANVAKQGNFNKKSYETDL